MNQNTSTVSELDRTGFKSQTASTDAAARWRKLLEDQRASGLAISAFCRERGIGVSSLFAWRRRLGAIGDGAGDCGSASGRGRFVRLTTAERVRGAGAVAADGVSIEFSAGLRVVVRSGFDRQLLRDVIDALSTPGGVAA
jgi:hypothetical protein